jgi:hypothetical protein
LFLARLIMKISPIPTRKMNEVQSLSRIPILHVQKLTIIKMCLNACTSIHGYKKKVLFWNIGRVSKILGRQRFELTIISPINNNTSETIHNANSIFKLNIWAFSILSDHIVISYINHTRQNNKTSMIMCKENKTYPIILKVESLSMKFSILAIFSN